jgi:hypothetical protein
LSAGGDERLNQNFLRQGQGGYTSRLVDEYIPGSY